MRDNLPTAELSLPVEDHCLLLLVFPPHHPALKDQLLSHPQVSPRVEGNTKLDGGDCIEDDDEDDEPDCKDDHIANHV